MSTLERQRDLAAMALRIGRQDIDELVRNCRWVLERKKDRPDVYERYLYVLRCLTEAQQLAGEIGMDGERLAQPLPPLEIWKNDYRWGDVLARTNCLARAA